jgi:hypothetical protein
MSKTDQVLPHTVWAYGTNWPNGGEIDIIEGVNTAHKNLISAHTAEGCSQDPWEVSQSTGLQRNTDCFVGDQNIGCGFEPPSSDVSSYGDSFNAVNGGVYAMDWDSERIRVWHFPRGRIPSDIKAKRPNPSNWGLPQAAFGGRSCDVDSYFKDMSIVLNIVSHHFDQNPRLSIILTSQNRTSAVTTETLFGTATSAAAMHQPALNTSAATLEPSPTPTGK